VVGGGGETDEVEINLFSLDLAQLIPNWKWGRYRILMVGVNGPRRPPIWTLPDHHTSFWETTEPTQQRLEPAKFCSGEIGH